MANRRRATADRDPVIEKITSGHYDRLLAEFETCIAEAVVVLRRTHEAMRAENTLRS